MRGSMKSRLVAIALAGVAASGLIAPVTAEAQARPSSRRNFNIPAQDMAGALEAFGRQSGKEILFDRAQVSGRRSGAVRGSYEPRDALNRLLRGSGLSMSMANDDTFLIGSPTLSGTGGSEVSGDQAALAPNDTPVSEPDIIVTANKREERLRDLPTAATVISGDIITATGIEDFRDYASLVPGLSQRDLGVPGQGTVILRGLNTGSAQATNTAAFYLDDAQFTPSSFLSFGAFFIPEPDLGDVERIEVLKGPQGTLYGANTLGGLIRVLSRAPDPREFSGSLRGEISDTDGGDMGYSGRAAVNIPLIDGRLAVRASGSYRRIGGFIENIGTGRENVNDSDLYGGRIALRFQPIDALTIDLVAFLQNIDSIGPALVDHLPGTLIPRYGRYTQSRFEDFPAELRLRLYNGSVNYDFGRLSWVTTIAYSQFSNNSRIDYTENYVPLVAALVPPGTAGRGILAPSTNKWTVESRLVSERIGPFEFIVGGYYTSEDTYYAAKILLVNPATGTLLPAPFDTLLRTATVADYAEIAGFGNLTFYLSDRIDLTGGIRFAHNRDISTVGALVDGLPPVIFFAPGSTQTFRFSENPVTYLATLRWRPTDQISTYLRAASGYRPGGPQTNANPPPGAQTEILSDTVWNYEAGIRASFLRSTLAMEASIYHIDWSDIQLNTLAGGTLLPGNAGAAEVDGFELALSARPTRFLTIAGSLGYTNARITEISPAATATIGAVAGDKLPGTPDWSGSLLVDQRIPLSENVEATIGATLRFQSDTPSSYPGNPLDTGIILPGFETLDLRGGVSFGNYSVQLRAENLFNTLAFLSATTNRVFPGQFVSTQASVIRPRNITLSVRVEF